MSIKLGQSNRCQQHNLVTITSNEYQPCDVEQSKGCQLVIKWQSNGCQPNWDNLTDVDSTTWLQSERMSTP